MESIIAKYSRNNQADSWETLIFLYESAMHKAETRINILNEEFRIIHKHDPIEHVKSRLKTPESIMVKLRKLEKDMTIENMIRYVNDIAGIRVICSFTSDIYQLVEIIKNQNDIRVLSVKDYIKNPKESGYMSYHMIIAIPIYLSDDIVDVKVEVQIRTVAQDFWASLEHKIYYKFEGEAPSYISRDLRATAQMIAQLDDHMMKLNEAIQEYVKDADK